MTYRERRSSKRFDCSARFDSSAGLEIFRNWIVNLREPDIWTEGGQLVLSCKRICPIINRCTYKIIQLLITPVDYQGSNFSAPCSGILGPVLLLRKNKRAKCARVRANQNSPSFTLLSFSFHVSLRFSTERATTCGSDTRWKTLICTCQSKWMKVRWHIAGAECYGDRIQLLKAVKPGE